MCVANILIQMNQQLFFLVILCSVAAVPSLGKFTIVGFEVKKTNRELLFSKLLFFKSRSACHGSLCPSQLILVVSLLIAAVTFNPVTDSHFTRRARFRVIWNYLAKEAVSWTGTSHKHYTPYTQPLHTSF